MLAFLGEIDMGHEGCGAVQAAMLDEQACSLEPYHVKSLINRILPAVKSLPRIRDHKAKMREAIIANVRTQVHQLKQNPFVMEAIGKQQISVIAAY